MYPTPTVRITHGSGCDRMRGRMQYVPPPAEPSVSARVQSTSASSNNRPLALQLCTLPPKSTLPAFRRQPRHSNAATRWSLLGLPGAGWVWTSLSKHRRCWFWPYVAVVVSIAGADATQMVSSQALPLGTQAGAGCAAASALVALPTTLSPMSSAVPAATHDESVAGSSGATRRTQTLSGLTPSLTSKPRLQRTYTCPDSTVPTWSAGDGSSLPCTCPFATVNGSQPPKSGSANGTRSLRVGSGTASGVGRLPLCTVHSATGTCPLSTGSLVAAG